MSTEGESEWMHCFLNIPNGRNGTYMCRNTLMFQRPFVAKPAHSVSRGNDNPCSPSTHVGFSLDMLDKGFHVLCMNLAKSSMDSGSYKNHLGSRKKLCKSNSVHSSGASSPAPSSIYYSVKAFSFGTWFLLYHAGSCFSSSVHWWDSREWPVPLLWGLQRNCLPHLFKPKQVWGELW